MSLPKSIFLCTVTEYSVIGNLSYFDDFSILSKVSLCCNYQWYSLQHQPINEWHILSTFLPTTMKAPKQALLWKGRIFQDFFKFDPSLFPRNGPLCENWIRHINVNFYMRVDIMGKNFNNLWLSFFHCVMYFVFVCIFCHLCRSSWLDWLAWCC